MVWQAVWAVVAETDALPLWLRLTPAARIRALLALVIVVILGLLLILFIRSFGRWIRYYARPTGDRSRRRDTVLAEDDWANRPLTHEESDDVP